MTEQRKYRHNTKDRTGHIYGHLTVITRHGSSHYGSATWLCRCGACGKECAVRGDKLQGGQTSCGCLPRHTTKKSTFICIHCHQEKPRECFKWYAGPEKRRKVCNDCHNITRRPGFRKDIKVTVTEKRCGACHKVLPADDFPRSIHHSGSLFQYCRSCTSRKYYERKHRGQCRHDDRLEARA